MYLQTVEFTSENFLFCFSDALIETKLKGDIFLDGDELIKLVKNINKGQENPHLLDQLISAFFENGGDELRDDLTAICFDYLKVYK